MYNNNINQLHYIEDFNTKLSFIISLTISGGIKHTSTNSC